MSRAGELAYAAIREGISSGDYVAGARLREEELSAAIGVSRTPVREALRRLSAEGIVEFLPNRGAHVAAWTDDDLEEIFELRATLEALAAYRAASRVDDDVIARLEELASAMEERLADPSDEGRFEVSQLNNEFHQLVLEVSGSRQLVVTTQGVIQVALVHRTFLRYSKRAMQRSFGHHRELIEALAARDASWSSSVMRSHILAARHIFSGNGDG
jgi:DNA-binding GntR family transcriptional regulator